MTLEQLKAAYPGCPEALDAHETELANAFLWPLAKQRVQEGWTLDEQLAEMKTCAALVVNMVGLKSVMAQALKEMDSPDFRRYVSDKLEGKI